MHVLFLAIARLFAPRGRHRRTPGRPEACRYTVVLTWRAPVDFFAPVVQYVSAHSPAEAWPRAYLQAGAVYRPYLAELAEASGTELVEAARQMLHGAAIFQGWPPLAQ